MPSLLRPALAISGLDVRVDRSSTRLHGAGLIEASIQVRNHSAAVSIPYTPDHYDIVYKDSTNLDHSGNRIHRNYNRWVKNLSTAIQRALIDEAYGKAR